MISRFLAATERAAEYITNHPQQAWKTFAATAPELDDALNARAWTDTVPRFAPSPAALDIGRYARFESFLHQAGLVPQLRPVKDLAIDVNAQ